MKTQFIVFYMLVAICSPVRAQTPVVAPFEIKSIKSGTNPQVYVDGSWKLHVPVIEVGVRTNEDLEGKKPFVKAYFYDKDKKLIVKASKPSDYTDPGKGTVKIPDHLKPKETYKVCFGITAQALDVHHKWARVIVVFGEGNRAAAAIFPSDDPTLFEFAEKAFATFKQK